MKINHIGIAVRNIDEAYRQFAEFGYIAEGELYTDEERKIKVQYLKNSEIRLELVMPINEQVASPVDRFIEVNKPYTMYHICYEVNNIDEIIDIFKQKGYYPMEVPQESPAMENCRTTYMFHKNMGLIEFVEV